MNGPASITDADMAAVEAYLSDTLEAEVTDIRLLRRGVNVSLAVDTTDGFRYVLRRPNKLRHTALFTDFATEYRVMQRLKKTRIPAPDPVAFCDDSSLLGDEFFLMTWLGGQGVEWGSRLPDRFRSPSARTKIGRQYIETLATIHTADPDPFTGVCDRVTPRAQLDRGIDRLDHALEETGDTVPVLWDVADWLRANVPSDLTLGLVHGDYKPDNVFLAGTDRPTISGVVDWETAMIGDPRAELGYFLLYWRDATDSWPSVDTLDTQSLDDDVVQQLNQRAATGFWPFTVAPGSPRRGDLVERWEEATGRSYRQDRFYRALAAFMLATVWADLHRHDTEAGRGSDRIPHIEYVGHLGSAIAAGDVPL